MEHLLTDEEMRNIGKEITGGLVDRRPNVERAIAKAQDAKTQRALVEWLAANRIGGGPVGAEPVWFKIPWKLWLALRRGILEEVKGEPRY